MKKITWFNELGFYSNPFSIKPAAFHMEVFGYDKLINEINDKVKDGNMLFIHGPYGTGKTTILKKVVNEFKGKRRVIYYNCNKAEGSIEFNKLLIRSGNFFSKLLNIKRKNRILLLDEAQDLNKKDLNNIKDYYDNSYFKSIIFVSKKDDIDLPKDLEKVIGKNNFNLNVLNNNEAITLIRKRIGDLNFLSDEMILKIFKQNKNPRAFLKNCEEVCRNAFELNAEKVIDKHVKDFAIN